jgi:hypothetical protein
MNATRILMVLALTAATAAQITIAGTHPGRGSGLAAAKKGRTVTGSWTVNAVPAPESGAPVFVSLATLTRDGSIVNSGMPGQSTGHGQWVKTGSQFAVTFIHLLYDVNGQVTGKVKVRASLTVDAQGDEISGPFNTDVFDAGGNPIFSFEGTVHGTRISVEPMD